MSATDTGRGNAVAAIIVGAGPAGSSVAHHLAAHNHRAIVLDRRKFPRDKSCGDAVTLPGVRILRQMGVLERLERTRRFEGMRVHVTGKNIRDYRYPTYSESEHGIVVPRFELDDALRQRAVEVGAELWEGTLATELLRDNGRVIGVRARRNGEEVELYAPFVVCAEGSVSGLARRSGLVASSRTEVGYGIRGYYEGIEGLADLIEFYMPVTDLSERFFLPSYGWVFPTTDTNANIGVGVSAEADGANLRRLMERFIAELRRTDPRFRVMQQCGSLRGAPVRSDFAPERCVAPGLLLVGDAAGMVSPFTGEGISYALEAGQLAARAVHRSLAKGSAVSSELDDYVAALRHRYGGYFETGQQAARRHQLVLRVIASTFDNDRPLFALCRRTALLPEGVGGLRTSDVLDDIAPLVGGLAAKLRTDLDAVDEVLIDALRRDWPFMARLALSAERDARVPTRPATLLLLCAYLGKPPLRDLAGLAAAVELSFAAGLAQASLEEDAEHALSSDGAEPNWGNIFAVLSSNFELAKAYQLTAPLGGEAIQQLATCLTTLCEGRAHELRHSRDTELSPDEYLEIVSHTSGAGFEWLCALGAWIGGVHPEHAGLLRDYGRHLGIAHHVAHEIMSISGRPSPVGPFAALELRRGRVNLPVIFALREGGPAAADLRALLAEDEPTAEDVAAVLSGIVASPSIRDALQEVRREGQAAEMAVEMLPEGPVRDALREVARFPYERALEELSGRASTRAPLADQSGDGAGVWALPERLGLTDEARRLDEFLRGWLRSCDPEFRELTEYQFSARSKLFRPVTAFACHHALDRGPISDDLLRAAAAIEFLHNATLVIDDVLDRDRYRRGVLSLHCRFGTLRALMAATYWSSAVTDWVADDPYIVRLLAELWQRLALAEGFQWRVRRQCHGLDVWRRIAGEDTGSMFETCARLGTHDDRLREFGRLLGILYHGCDDVADVRGAAALGGGSEKDITDRILTLPAAIAIRDIETATLFQKGGPEANDELAQRFAAVLPEAESVLDGIADEVEAEAQRGASSPELLLKLVRHTRALSNA